MADQIDRNLSFVANNLSLNNISLLEEEEVVAEIKSGSPVAKVVFASIEIVLMLVILSGNGLTIVAVKRFPRLQTMTNQLLLSLCVADVMVGLAMPFHAAFFLGEKTGTRSMMHSSWFACVTRYVTILMPCAASILNLLLIAFDRYVAILHPLRYQTILNQTTLNILNAGKSLNM